MQSQKHRKDEINFAFVAKTRAVARKVMTSSDRWRREKAPETALLVLCID